MSIKKFAVTPTSRLHLRDGNDDPMYADGDNGKPDQSKPMVAVLYGPGSKQYARAQAVQNNDYINKLKKKGKTEQSEEEQRRENVKFLVACTHSFENVEYEGLTGEALYKAVYEDIEIGFVAEQVGKHIRDWSNFSTASTTN